MFLSFSFLGRILWTLIVTNRIVKSSEKPDVFLVIHNKFCQRPKLELHPSLTLSRVPEASQSLHGAQEASPASILQR